MFAHIMTSVKYELMTLAKRTTIIFLAITKTGRNVSVEKTEKECENINVKILYHPRRRCIMKNR